ncbi:response regulator [Pedococcus bigeumensis]|uniref:histidine kinase n=1 Tax=Pedococcus bigeumensis TaxID=433644 RepID=A0A502CWT6_9MICO|nr:response regulator [Pedococcus bigeumensis]TPG17124.1 response regulator [Pedococcus bigeumensis]
MTTSAGATPGAGPAETGAPARTPDLAAELQEARNQLAAVNEVLSAVGRSAGDPDMVLTTIVDSARRLCRSDAAQLCLLDDHRVFQLIKAVGISEEAITYIAEHPLPMDRDTLMGRVGLDRRPQQIEDVVADPEYGRLDLQRVAGFRTTMGAPLIVDDEVVGAMVLWRNQVSPFAESEMTIVTAFAAQAALAINSVRLVQELQAGRAELAEASQHKSEFLASMSHELRTPLNAVIGFSEVLLERMFGDLNERQEDYLRDILSSGRHLLALLNDVLDLSKVEAGHMELDPTEFAVAETVDYALSMVRERAVAHGIILSRDVGAGVDVVRADELRIKQVLLNLLSNAVKFTPDGGRVEVRARGGAVDLEITVSDTGMGVDPADQQRIFDSFQQGGRAARQVEGTGLGLTLTKRIVELHGGRLWLNSEVGHGSTFGFSIPLDRSAGAAVGLPGRAAQTDDRPVVVVVEDDRSSAELMSLHLEAAGLRPVTVPNGADGLTAVRDLSPAAVILDIRLPGMDGWDVLGAIKGDPHTAATPVVVVSVIHERGRGFALGASDYLVKPVARDDLLAALRRLVDLPVDRATRKVAVFVDDDPLALELVRLALEPAGWIVHTCTTAAVAMTLIRTHDPSVVLVDLLMPETDGFEVVDILRSDPQTASLPVVVLTAKTLTPRDRALLDGRIDFVMSKSTVDLGLLAERLAQITSAPVRARGKEAG